jgi:hypothetical protein
MDVHHNSCNTKRNSDQVFVRMSSMPVMQHVAHMWHGDLEAGRVQSLKSKKLYKQHIV